MYFLPLRYKCLYVDAESVSTVMTYVNQMTKEQDQYILYVLQ
jgi:hypothetical protein